MLTEITRKAVLAAISLMLMSCAAYDLSSRHQHGLNLDVVAQTAKNAVEKEFNVDLGHVKWEVADAYRLNRLTYLTAHSEYEKMVNHPFYARLLSDLASSNASTGILGKYKDNIKTIFINPERLDESYGYDMVNLAIARQIYLSLFIHEFVHAADFAKFTEELRSEAYLPGQSELLSAMLEGNAEYITEKLCKEYACEEGYDIINHGSKEKSRKTQKSSSEKSKKQGRLSKIYKEELRFRYRLGKQYIADKYQAFPDKDPMPRNLAELPDSQMLILYPENDRLKQNSFKTATQLMDALSVLQSYFPDEGYVYHYEVFSPPRLLDAVKKQTSIKLSLKDANPPYLQAMTLKLHWMPDKSKVVNNQGDYDLIVIDMGEEEKSQRFMQQVADGQENKPLLNTIERQSTDSVVRYIAADQKMVIQSEGYVLLVELDKGKINTDYVLKFSTDILSSI